MAIFGGWPRLPRYTVGLCLLSVGSIAVTTVAQADIVVQRGDSLWSLARKHGVTIAALQEANQLGASEQIRAGQTLRLPPAAKTSAEASKPATAPAATTSRTTTDPRSPNPDDVALAKPAPSPTVSAKPQPVESGSVNETPTPRIDPSKDTLAERIPSWVLAEPGPETQGEKPAVARGGIFPCSAPDPGFAHYAKWVQVAPMAHVLAPPASPTLSSVRPDGGFDVVFHFHGREPLRKEWVRAMQGNAEDAVLVAVDIGIASEAYRETFRDPRTFSQVILAVEAELQRRSGNPRAFAQNITLSSWSAGYGAVEQLLSQPIPQSRVGSVVLLDGLHAGFRDAGLNDDRMRPFVEFAKRAANGSRLMFVSHSSIRTPGYASTTQTARYLVWKLGGQPSPTATTAVDPMGLERHSTFTSGNFHVRGFSGSGAADHCAHLGLMRDVLNVHLKPFWQRTRASVEPAAVARRGN